MKTKYFLNHLEKKQLVDAIRQAEEGNSGDIILLITRKKIEEPVAAAQAEFDQLFLRKKTHPNAVLMFLAPESQRLGVVGGTSIYAKLPPEWWEQLVAEIGTHLAKGNLTEGLIFGIEKIGQVLKEHFPAEKIDRSGQSDFLTES